MAVGWLAGAREWFASHRSSRFFRYGFAVITVLAAFGLTWVIPPLHAQSPDALMLTAIVLSALYAGLGPGLLATSLALLIINTYFVPPHPYRILPTAVADVVRLGVFVMLALLVSSL